MEISAGIHTFKEVLDLAGLEVDQNFDRRRISVGGLSFDDPEEKFRVVGEELVVLLDGEGHSTFTVTE